MTPRRALERWALFLSAACLLGLGFMVLMTGFSKYEGADAALTDCDTDAEAALTLFVFLVWIMTAALIAWIALARRPLGKNLHTLCLAIAMGVSLGSAVKFIALLNYSQITSVACGAVASFSSAGAAVSLERSSGVGSTGHRRP